MGEGGGVGKGGGYGKEDRKGGRVGEDRGKGGGGNIRKGRRKMYGRDGEMDGRREGGEGGD